MPLPINIRAERMDGHAESDWIITGEVGGQRIEVARVQYKGHAYDHGALAVLLAAAAALYEALRDIIDSVAVTETMGEVCQKSDFDDARAALQSATTIPTTDEGGR